MAPATTSPIKILSDLGYEVWEIESDADMLRALVEAVNSLIITNPSDGRIPILQNAVKEIRGASRAASSSKSQNFIEKRTTLKGSKFIPRAKPKAKATANKVAMLPAAQDDNAPIFSTLLNGLKNIASLLKNIALLLGAQFRFKRLLAARQRKADALEAKRKREEGLEDSEKSGIKSGILSSIAKPVKSFWDKLLNFFKTIILASAVLGFYKWMKDPKNLETIKGIADWFGKHGKKVLIGIAAILGLRLGFRLYRLYQGIKRLVNLFRNLGRKPKPRVPGEQASNVLKSNAQKRRDALIKQRELNRQRRRSFLKTKVKTPKPAPVEVEIPSKSPVRVGKPGSPSAFTGDQTGQFVAGTGDAGAQFKDTTIDEARLKIQSDYESPFTPKVQDAVDLTKPKPGQDLKNFFKMRRAYGLDMDSDIGLSMRTFNQPKIDYGKLFDPIDLLDDSPKNIELARKMFLADDALGGIPFTAADSGADNPLFKLAGTTFEPKLASNLTPIERLGQRIDNIFSGFKSGFVEMLEKAGMSKSAISTGGKIVQHSLPFVGAAFDFLAMMDNFDKGNYTAGSLFAIGGAASALSGLALSSGAFAGAAVPLSLVSTTATIFGMLAQAIETGVKNRVEDPNFQMGRKSPNPQARFKKYTVDPDKNYITPRSRRRNNKSMSLPSNNSSSLSSGSGATNSDITTVASFDTNNPQLIGNSAEYEVIGAYS